MRTPLLLCSSLLLLLQPSTAFAAASSGAEGASQQASTIPRRGSTEQHVIAQGVHDPSFAGMGASESVTHKAHIKRSLVGAASVLGSPFSSSQSSDDTPPPSARKIKRSFSPPAEHMHHNRDLHHAGHIKRALVGSDVHPRSLQVQGQNAEPIPARKWKRSLAPPAEHVHQERGVIAQVIGGALGQPGVSAQEQKKEHAEVLKRMEHDELRRGLERRNKERAKRWVWGTSIIQDGDTGPGIPGPGDNVNMFTDPAVTLNTPSTTPPIPSMTPPSSAESPSPSSSSSSADTSPAPAPPAEQKNPRKSPSPSPSPSPELSPSSSSSSEVDKPKPTPAPKKPRIQPLAQPLTLASLNNLLTPVHPPQTLGQRDLGKEHGHHESEKRSEVEAEEDQEEGEGDVVVVVAVGWQEADDINVVEVEEVKQIADAEELPKTKTAPGFSKEGHMDRVKRVVKKREAFREVNRVVARD